MTTARTLPGPPLPVLPRPWSGRTAAADEPDLDLIRRWMHAPHVAAFWKQDWTRDRWADELRDQLAGDHSLPCLIDHDGTTIAYLEVYRVARDRLADFVDHRPTDLGVHVAIGDLGRTGRGLGTALLRAVADGLLAAAPDCDRVVAEPDVHNTSSIRAFGRAGFHPAGEISLPDKTATLLIHPRDGTTSRGSC